MAKCMQIVLNSTPVSEMLTNLFVTCRFWFRRKAGQQEHLDSHAGCSQGAPQADAGQMTPIP